MSLSKALKSGDFEKVKSIILEENVNPNTQDPKSGQTIIHILANESQIDLIVLLLDKSPPSEEFKANLEIKDKEDKVSLGQKDSIDRGSTDGKRRCCCDSFELRSKPEFYLRKKEHVDALCSS